MFEGSERMANRYCSGECLYSSGDNDTDFEDRDSPVSWCDLDPIFQNGASVIIFDEDSEDNIQSLQDYLSRTKIDDRPSCISLDDDSVIEKLKVDENTQKKLSVITSEIEIGSTACLLLRQSLFPNVPPTINFVIPTETVKCLPEEIYKVLKWHLTSTTPLVLKKIIANMGLKFSRNSKNWVGMWGKHRKAFQFRFVKDFQKVNHFPGTFQIGRKDRLWRNMFRMQFLHGRKEFDFVPSTFVLPNDLPSLRQAWEMGGSSQLWILKPPASSRGTGVKVIHKFAQVPKRGHLIVQKYLSKPFLINGAKFDLRLYVYVSSYNPLRIYLHEDGLVRFASVKYSSSPRSLSDRYMHLTNYCVNRRSLNYLVNEDAQACKGHKWSLKALWGYLETRNIDVNDIKRRIDDIIVKTVISIESSVGVLMRDNVTSRYSCHELFGFDIMMDENLKLWLLEVNISPSLHSSSSLDILIKGQMLKDLLNIAGFHIPSHVDNTVLSSVATYLGTTVSPNLVHNESRYYSQLDPEEKRKQMYFVLCDRNKYLGTILEHLTPDDVRILVETEDELERSGGFRRILPSRASNVYSKYFDTITNRYYSYLFDAWEYNYGSCREEGRATLGNLCAQRYHLEGLVERLSPKLNMAAWQCISRHKVSKIHNSTRYRRKKVFVKSWKTKRVIPGHRRSDRFAL